MVTPPPPSSLPSYAHLTSELSPSFIHADLSLSRRIYICCCRAKVVSHFICADFIGSRLLNCFGLCVVSEAQRVKSLGVTE